MTTPDGTTILTQPIPADIPAGQRTAVQRQIADKLLHRLLGPDVSIVRSANGAPNLQGASGNISISHCRDLVAIAYNPTHPIGIDVETWRDQLLRVANRFLDSDELSAIGLDHSRLLQAWTIKEAVYKLLRVDSLPLRGGIKILSPTAAEATTPGQKPVAVAITTVIAEPDRALTLATFK